MLVFKQLFTIIKARCFIGLAPSTLINPSRIYNCATFRQSTLFSFALYREWRARRVSNTKDLGDTHKIKIGRLKKNFANLWNTIPNRNFGLNLLTLFRKVDSTLLYIIFPITIIRSNLLKRLSICYGKFPYRVGSRDHGYNTSFSL
jgi:hypothetical protein